MLSGSRYPLVSPLLPTARSRYPLHCRWLSRPPFKHRAFIGRPILTQAQRAFLSIGGNRAISSLAPRYHLAKISTARVRPGAAICQERGCEGEREWRGVERTEERDIEDDVIALLRFNNCSRAQRKYAIHSCAPLIQAPPAGND